MSLKIDSKVSSAFLRHHHSLVRYDCADYWHRTIGSGHSSIGSE